MTSPNFFGRQRQFFYVRPQVYIDILFYFPNSSIKFDTIIYTLGILENSLSLSYGRISVLLKSCNPQLHYNFKYSIILLILRGKKLHSSSLNTTELTVAQLDAKVVYEEICVLPVDLPLYAYIMLSAKISLLIIEE